MAYASSTGPSSETSESCVAGRLSPNIAILFRSPPPAFVLRRWTEPFLGGCGEPLLPDPAGTTSRTVTKRDAATSCLVSGWRPNRLAQGFDRGSVVERGKS